MAVPFTSTRELLIRAQRGQIPILFSAYETQCASNLRCIVENPLADSEMAILQSVYKNCRLIKGQVFLWEVARSWEDLWDLDRIVAR